MRDDGFLMNLPHHIIIDILSRLPVKTIIHCKCVCKIWLELFSVPEFAALHFSRSSPGLVFHQSEMYKNFIRLVDYEDAVDQHNLYYDSVMKFNLSTLSPFPDANIVMDGSINGFLFLRDTNYKHETLYICNPITQEYVILPSPSKMAQYSCIVTHGFGVSTMSGQYKVVRIFQDNELDPISGSCLRISNSECQVYTLGTGAWRGIGFGTVSYAYNSRSIGLFLKGNLHWLIEDLEESEKISCFDLEKELFKPLSPPFLSRKFQGSLGVLEECLCLCDNTSYFDIVIWIMKEYGVTKSWSKEIVITKMPELKGPSYVIVHALKVFRDGGILLLWGDFFMLHYCSKNKIAQVVDMKQSRGPNSIEAMHHVSSFLSLRSFSMEKVNAF